MDLNNLTVAAIGALAVLCIVWALFANDEPPKDAAEPTSDDGAIAA